MPQPGQATFSLKKPLSFFCGSTRFSTALYHKLGSERKKNQEHSNTYYSRNSFVTEKGITPDFATKKRENLRKRKHQRFFFQNILHLQIRRWKQRT
jgi:hypothetical protein